jgi:hypothetical protein
MLSNIIRRIIETTEEVCFQAHMLNRRVFIPVISFLWVRKCWELFPDALGNSYRALRLLVLPIAKDLGRKWGSQGTIE